MQASAAFPSRRTCCRSCREDHEAAVHGPPGLGDQAAAGVVDQDWYHRPEQSAVAFFPPSCQAALDQCRCAERIDQRRGWLGRRQEKEFWRRLRQGEETPSSRLPRSRKPLIGSASGNGYKLNDPLRVAHFVSAMVVALPVVGASIVFGQWCAFGMGRATARLFLEGVLITRLRAVQNTRGKNRTAGHQELANRRCWAVIGFVAFKLVDVTYIHPPTPEQRGRGGREEAQLPSSAERGRAMEQRD